MDNEKIVFAILIAIVALVIIGLSFSEMTGQAYTAAKYRRATWTCPDNVRADLSYSPCRTQSQWSDYARNYCSSHCVRAPSGYRQCNPNNLRVLESNRCRR